MASVDEQMKKGMGYGELIVDNILGLDNEYESFGEKLGKVIDKDELKFLKDAAVGVYEGAKEFITSPVETTKEVVTNIKDSVQRLGSEDLDTRLQNMYSVSYDQATDQQVNSAREAVIGDAMTALELIPAAKAATVTAKAASSAVPSGVKADIVGQTKAVFDGDMEFLKGTPTERSGTVGVGAEVVGQDNVSLDDINDYMDLEVQPTKSKKETNPLVRSVNASNVEVQADLADFRSSVLGSLDNLAIGKDGMSGFQIKKFLEKRAPKINKTELYWSGLLENLDDNKKYSKQQLKTLADRNVPKVDIEVLRSNKTKYRGEQRVVFQSNNPNGDIINPLDSYIEIILRNKNTKGTKYDAADMHFYSPEGENILAHVRGSFVKTDEIKDSNFPIKEKFFIVEELQSDAVQQHTVADKAIAKKIKEQEISKPTLGDIGLHYQTEFGDITFSYHMKGIDFTDKFVNDMNRYNYDFRSIGDQDTAEQAVNLGLTKIIDDIAKLKSDFVDGNRNKDAIAFLLSREYGLKENSIKRRSIEELDEVDNIFANVLSDYVFGKSAARKFNKEYNNKLKEDLINTFKSINITAGIEEDLVPAKLSDTIRMSLLAVIKESKDNGTNKIYIPTPKVIARAHDLSLDAAKNTYSDGVRKVLRSLNSETNGKIKFKNKNPDNLIYYDDMNETGIEIDITDFDLPDDPQFRFAEGGVVKDMDNQMKMALMQEGGLQDDGMSQDPVSGNEIPNGSMASEVRDDIPAQLSEGEYVVPADVVRFFGVKFFEDLRSEAKMGLQQMDKDGRIGGEPVAVTAIMGAAPISDAELDQLIQQELSQEAKPAMAMGGLMANQQPTMQQQQPMMQQQQPMMQPQPNPYQQQQQMMYNKPTINMNKGGFISTSMESLRAGYAPGGSVTGFDPSKYSYGGTGSGMGSGLKVIQYVNDAGNIRWYTFIDGKIQPPGTKIPAGYKPSDPSLNAPLPETPVTPPPDTGVTPPDSGDRDDKDDGGGGSKDPQDQIEVDMSKKLKEVDWDGDLLGQAKGFVQDNQGQDISKLGGAAALLGGPGAIIGGVMGVGGKIMELEGISNARAMSLIAEARGDTEAANKINEFVDSHVKARGGLIDFADGFVAKGTMRANDLAKDFGFDSLEDAKENKDEFNKTFKSRKTGFVGVMGDMTAQERKAMVDKANKDAKAILDAKAAKDKKSSGSSRDDDYSAADMMRDRLDRMSKAEGQSGGFQGSVTSGSVYAGGNRAKGGLMLKKKNK